jgi:hypothetical protein
VNVRSDPDRPRLAIVEEVGAELHRLFRTDEARHRRGATIVRRIRARPRVVVALLAVLVGATAAAAAVSLSAGRTAPIPLPGPGGRVLCPGGYEYLAYASLRLVYPPNYPGPLPRSARGTGCYASAYDAQSAGYTIAPTPRGDARIGPLYLAPASAVVRRTCQNARRQLGVAVYCPRRLPAPWTDPANGIDEDCPSAACGVPLLSITGQFSAPSSYIGSAPGAAEVTLWAVTSRQERLYPYLIGCVTARPIRRTVFRGHPANWYECPIFGDNTSAVLEWRIGQETYGISANGPASLRHRLVEYIATQLVRLPPAH